MPDATFDPHHVAVLVRQPSQETNGGLYIFRMDQVEKPSADKFLVAITDNSFGRWPRVKDHPGPVQQSDRVRTVLNERAKPLLAGTQFLFRPLSLGGIARNDEDPVHVSLVTADHAALGFDVADGSVFTQETEFRPFSHSCAHGFFKHLLYPGDVVRVYLLKGTGALKGLRIAEDLFVRSAVV